MMFGHQQGTGNKKGRLIAGLFEILFLLFVVASASEDIGFSAAFFVFAIG